VSEKFIFQKKWFDHKKVSELFLLQYIVG